jgi:hypothetical protein
MHTSIDCCMQAHGQHDLHTVDWCGLRDYMIATGEDVQNNMAAIHRHSLLLAMVNSVDTCHGDDREYATCDQVLRMEPSKCGTHGSWAEAGCSRSTLLRCTLRR